MIRPLLLHHDRCRRHAPAFGLPSLELEAMTAAGILLEDERIELIGGESFRCRRQGNQHEVVKTALTHYWSLAPPKHLIFAPR